MLKRLEPENLDSAALEKLFSERGLILFGTGYVAGVWLKILRERRMEKVLRYFVVSRCEPGTFFSGYPVYRLDEAPLPPSAAPETLPVLGLAVHEVLAEKLLFSLRASYPGDCLYLYPRMHEFAFGPALREEEIPLTRLLQAQPANNFWITSRYAALCEHKKAPSVREVCAADIYLKHQRLFSSEETAKARLERFFQLAESPFRDRVLRENPIIVDERLRVVDGLHRIALCCYVRQESLQCRFVRSSNLYDELFTEKNRLTPSAQRLAGLSEQEQALLLQTKMELLHGECEQIR